MKSLQWLATTLFLFVSATLLYAQTGGGIGSAGGLVVGSGMSGVKGVPFSADIVNVFTRVLPDGNRINRETHGKTFRDSEGRTRNETEMDLMNGVKRVNVMISDPVQQVMIILDPQAKTATVHPFNLPMTHSRVTLPQADAVGATAGTTASPASLMAHQSSREPLGVKEIEGFTVSGTRFSNTIEAGRIGNEKPITSVHENWFSEELKVDLLTTRDDPQSGQNTRRLINIRAGEPDPLLFQVPADYTVKDNQ
jgi:hypothetical protein